MRETDGRAGSADVTTHCGWGRENSLFLNSTKNVCQACNPCLFNYLHLNNLKIAVTTLCASCGWLPSNFSVEKVFNSLISYISLPVLGSNLHVI